MVNYGKKVTSIGHKSGTKGGSTPPPPPPKRCFHSHPPLSLGKGLVVYGGSCSLPVEADIHIGLDASMKDHDSSFPWNPGTAFYYRIVDYRAPSNHDSFKKMIEWIAQEIKSGKKVHIGCIGGHGRTGTVLSALVAYMNVSTDPIKYVRENYCKKAVESQEQIDFLVKHFGCLPAEIAKAPHVMKPDHTGFGQGQDGFNFTPSSQNLKALKHECCIWSE